VVFVRLDGPSGSELVKVGGPWDVVGAVYNDKNLDKSWKKLNSALHQALTFAIEVGLFFEREEIGAISTDMKGQYWFSEDEYLATACRAGNLSAALSCQWYRSWRPWRWSGTYSIHGRRGELKMLCVGAELWVDGLTWQLTEMEKDRVKFLVQAGEGKRRTGRWLTRKELKELDARLNPKPVKTNKEDK
jgi:hypothetical protein